MNNHSEIVSFLWSVADIIRDTFKRGKYQDVILPLTVLRPLDCVLEPTKGKVLETYNQYKGKLDNLDPVLRKASGFAFYNTSRYDFDKLLADSHNLADNLRAYINGFSPNMREVLEKFDFDNTIAKLDEAGLLFLVLERFNSVDLHPDTVSNHEMGTVFEELIRKFNEALNENPGEHFTPREVIRLMVDLLVVPDKERVSVPHRTVTVYDPCSGSGGMLTTAQDRLESLNPQIVVHLFGQEVNPETYAICKSDLYMKSADGHEAENIAYGSTLSDDKHVGRSFDYILANPPYGKDWKRDCKAVEDEAKRGHAGRFGAGTPRISDGQLLFLQHMIHHRQERTNVSSNGSSPNGGSRIAIVMNGSPLFTGDAGSGESEIRRWILENDWLEAIVALPEQLFYNTGIATYVWVLSNRKDPQRKGKVQLINATDLWVPMRKSLGDKRRAISPNQIAEIVQLYEAFEEGERSKIFKTTDFGYRKIRVERPLRLNVQATPERIEQLKEETAFQNLARSRKRNKDAKAKEEAEGRQHQQAILALLHSLPPDLFKDRKAFTKLLNKRAKEADVKLTASVRNAILSALGERDESAAICTDSKGNPEPDSDLRDYENVPLDQDVHDYFEQEVQPHVPDAFIDESYKDELDGGVGRVGYEINFNRYFYTYEPPRLLGKIEADIRQLEGEIMEMLREVVA